MSQAVSNSLRYLKLPSIKAADKKSSAPPKKPHQLPHQNQQKENLHNSIASHMRIRIKSHRLNMVAGSCHPPLRKPQEMPARLTKQEPQEGRECFFYKKQNIANSKTDRPNKHNTLESTDKQTEGSCRGASFNRRKTMTKEEFAQSIMDRIKISIVSPQKSGSVGLKISEKKRKAIDECKVTKVPWRSKSKFNPQVSSINENNQLTQMQSLRQIVRNIPY